MMNNLFSIFDPSQSFLKMNWFMFLSPILILSSSLMKTSKTKILLKIILSNLKKELNSMLQNKNKFSSSNFMIILFLSIMIINSSSLLPFNFTITSQISFNFPTAFSMWMSFLILGWTKKYKSMMAHLVPTGTPNALLPMMVLIEMTSQLIRPITLSVRLTANMVAGHLLMNLLGNFSLSSHYNFIFSSPILMMLTMLEMCVSVIQAYVFMTLLTLYSTEIN